MNIVIILSCLTASALIIYYTDSILKLTISDDYKTKEQLIKALIPFYNWYKIFIDNYNNLPSAKEK